MQVKNLVFVEIYEEKETGNKRKKYTNIGSVFIQEHTNKETGEIFETQTVKIDFVPTKMDDKSFIQIMQRQERSSQ